MVEGVRVITDLYFNLNNYDLDIYLLISYTDTDN